ncbi:dihydropteroate synthase [Sphingomonas sp. HDW15A]|uniref:dihydropteroate synthase n=1 Tax=Sphingomonas sp. HDW15A TaxID=2714942 RepID=UPI001407B77E|nr:dihydropteroate synthase [Sphingomonas sp. HDW15A]QIK95700.1 dihydropteroate synthase [Sphingomonas sp. HDW15A]
MRTLIRPTGFVDSPFGLDGKVARLAGGLNWFAQCELIHPDGARELVPVEGIESRLDGSMAADWQRLISPRGPLQLGERTIRLDQPQVMGIVNVTPDSFSDGGAYADSNEAAFAGADMTAAGAAILDVGGESTRPGAKAVWEGDEIERVLPVVRRLASGGNAVSIDTRKASVAEAALGGGAHLVNDVSAMTYDPRMTEVVAASEVPIILMHHQGEPQTMQEDPRYTNVLVEVFYWLEERIAAAESAGIARDRILVDPGIGFGKTVAHNLALLNGLALFHGLGCPIVLGASRKRMIGALSNEAPADQRLAGSIALALKAAEQGAQVIRVHDVPETVQALKVWRGLRDQALTPRIG